MTRSRGEIKIDDILTNNYITFESEYIFPSLTGSSGRPLRFDFAIFDDDGNIDFLIEYQGEQHYTSVTYFGGQRKLHQQKHNDASKRRFCYDRSYPLVLIPYWDYDKVSYDYIFSEAERVRL